MGIPFIRCTIQDGDAEDDEFAEVSSKGELTSNSAEERVSPSCEIRVVGEEEVQRSHSSASAIGDLTDQRDCRCRVCDPRHDSLASLNRG